MGAYVGYYSKKVESQKRESEKPKSPFSLSNTLVWIVILLAVLAVLNIILLVVYRLASTDKDIWTVIWEYFGSDTFNLVTISLLFPIVSLFLENLLEVRKAVNERIANQKKAITDRKDKNKQAGLEARQKCVEQTSKIWNDVFTLLSEVRFYKKERSGASKELNTKNKKDDNTAPKEPSIQDLEEKLDNLVNSASQTMSNWYFWFPNLRSTDFSENALYLLNILFCTSNTITYFIRKEDDPGKIEELQCTLREIQNGVKRILYHPLICILLNSVSAWEGLMEEDRAKVARAEKEIDFWLAKLREDANKVRKDELKNNVILSTLKGGRPLQKAAEELEKFMEQIEISDDEISKRMKSQEFSDLKEIDYAWARKLAKEEIFVEKFSKSEQFHKFSKLFSKIGHQRLAQIHPKYSRKWVEHLSDWLHFDSTATYLLSRAEWAYALRKKKPRKAA